MEPKKLITIFVVLAIVALAVGFGYMWYKSQQAPDGYYNYEGEEASSFQTGEGGTVSAPSEKKFYIVDITLRNDTYGPGLNTIQLIWKMTIDGMTFQLDVDKTILHKDFTSMTFEKGKLWNYTVVFTIPKNMTIANTSLGYTYASTDTDPNLSYDPNLRLPDSIETVMCADVLGYTRF